MQEKLEGTNAASWAEGRHAPIRWYQAHQRALPWRESPHPYAVWLCEIIMQQTRIDQGLKYWNTFVNTWTDVHALASAPLDDVLKAWQGLGYYSRARNLHRAAQAIAFERGGAFPETAEAWRAIPGVGPYTAAAIASICFNEPVALSTETCSGSSAGTGTSKTPSTGPSDENRWRHSQRSGSIRPKPGPTTKR